MDPKYVKRRYVAAKQPGSLSGLSGFFNNSKYKSKKEVEKVLQSLYTYNIHRQARKNFKRYPMMCMFADYLWQADLIVYEKYKYQNNQYAYILLCVDCFTKFVFCEAVKKKTAENVKEAFRKIIDRSKRHPTLLHTDRGGEFFGKPMSRYLREKGIKLYSTFSPLKAMLAERAIRTLKTRLERLFTQTGKKRWIDALQDIVYSINNTVHSTIKMKPSDANKKSNHGLVWNNIYKKYIDKNKGLNPRYSVGDFVKVAKHKLLLEKGYTANFSKETFKIKTVLLDQPVVLYHLSDLDGNEIEGKFQEPELIRVENGENTV